MTTIVVPAFPSDAKSGDQTWLKFCAWKLARNCQLLARYPIALWSRSGAPSAQAWYRAWNASVRSVHCIRTYIRTNGRWLLRSRARRVGRCASSILRNLCVQLSNYPLQSALNDFDVRINSAVTTNGRVLLYLVYRLRYTRNAKYIDTGYLSSLP